MLQGVLLDDRYPHVRVAERLNTVPDAHDELVLLAHPLHILGSVGTLVGALRLYKKKEAYRCQQPVTPLQ